MEKLSPSRLSLFQQNSVHIEVPQSSGKKRRAKSITCPASQVISERSFEDKPKGESPFDPVLLDIGYEIEEIQEVSEPSINVVRESIKFSSISHPRKSNHPASFYHHRARGISIDYGVANSIVPSTFKLKHNALFKPLKATSFYSRFEIMRSEIKIVDSPKKTPDMIMDLLCPAYQVVWVGENVKTSFKYSSLKQHVETTLISIPGKTPKKSFFSYRDNYELFIRSEVNRISSKPDSSVVASSQNKPKEKFPSRDHELLGKIDEAGRFILNISYKYYIKDSLSEIESRFKMGKALIQERLKKKEECDLEAMEFIQRVSLREYQLGETRRQEWGVAEGMELDEISKILNLTSVVHFHPSLEYTLYNSQWLFMFLPT